MQVIENSITIERAAENVFDYCSDMRTEADWNPAASVVTLLSAEPVGLGSTFSGTWRGAGTSLLEVAAFDRPATWITRTTDAALPFRLVGTSPAIGPEVTRLTMRIELLPTGVKAIFGPLVRMMMQSTAKANLVRIKAAVESA